MLGIECVGEVVDNGGLSLGPGETVAAIMGGMGREFDGSYAEYTLVPHGMNLAVELFNTSKRTLQRRLGEMGTSYSELLDHARFRAASLLLGNPAMTVTDIGHQLGYSDVAHFTRAFRRIAGVTPLAYRQQLNY